MKVSAIKINEAGKSCMVQLTDRQNQTMVFVDGMGDKNYCKVLLAEPMVFTISPQLQT